MEQKAHRVQRNWDLNMASTLREGSKNNVKFHIKNIKKQLHDEKINKIRCIFIKFCKNTPSGLYTKTLLRCTLSVRGKSYA